MGRALLALAILLFGSSSAWALSRPAISYSPGSVVCTLGAAVATIKPVNTGGAATSWTITPALPGGLSFAAGTGQIAGTPTVLSAARSYTVRASNSAGSGSATLRITVNDVPPAFSYNPSAEVCTRGTAITPLAPATSGGTVVAWSIAPALSAGLAFSTASGWITGTPTATSAATVYTVRATNSGGSATAKVTLTVGDVPPVTLTLNPASATVDAGGTVSITATVLGSGNTSILWTVDGIPNGNAAVGTLTGSGNAFTYAAPTVAGTHSLVATSAASSSATATLTVSVKPPVVTVTLSPAGPTSLAASQTLDFTATVTGSSNTSVTWSVDGLAGGSPAVGTLAGSGNVVTYAAPGAAGSHSVVATSLANPACSATATVLVQAPQGSGGTTTAVVLTPAAPTAVGSGGTLAFSASATGNASDTFAWSVDGIPGGSAAVGTISAAGVYTCPAVTVHAIHTITATSASNSSISASVDILATVSNATVNARTSYGAAGNGSSNDTSAINSALAAAGQGICLLPAGTYLVNATASGTYGIDLPSGATLLMAPGASLQCITQTTRGDYKVVRIAGAGSAVVGGTIYGDRVARNLPNFNDGVGTDFENGQGIAINGSGGGTGNIVLGVTSRDNACDGIYMYNGVNGVTVQDCTFDNNRRQGISIVYGTNVLIKNCSFTNTNGQDPAFGIDLEPSGSGQVVSYVQVLGCSFTANQGGGFGGGSSNASVNNITVSGSTFTGNGGHNYGVGGIAFNDGASNCVISNNTITGSLAGGEEGGILLEGISNFQVTGNIVKNNAGFGITLASAPGSSCSGNTLSGNSLGAIYSDGSASIGGNTIQ